MRTANRFMVMALSPALLAGCSVHSAGESAGGTDAPYSNVRYTIEGRSVQLVDGVASSDGAPGSAARVVTRYFGEALEKDLDGDGRGDAAVLLSQDRGGSGTFYYVAAALRTDGGYAGSEAMHLGDRIVPRGITSGPGRSIIVSYAERVPGEPMTTPPSRTRSMRLLLDQRTLQFGEVAQDFTGEADPARMTLGMKPWTWVRALYNDGREVLPRQPGRFTLTLSADGTFSAATDCNQVRGSYTARDGAISFGADMMSTRMFCEGSQETAFTSLLREAQRYHFTSRGELVFDLKMDSGIVVFR